MSVEVYTGRAVAPRPPRSARGADPTICARCLAIASRRRCSGEGIVNECVHNLAQGRRVKMVERDDLVATYSVDYVAGVMSLRKPQKESLISLEKIWNAADIRKGADLADNLARVKELYPLCKDFERAFPSLAFALATGVGKTRLMGAFITWLYVKMFAAVEV